VPTANSLEKLLRAQLGVHARVHLGTVDLPHIRVVDSARMRGKSISKTSNVFSIVEKLLVYAGSCGSVARGGIGDLKQAGMILLVRSSSGLQFHVELGGPGEQLAVTRVSTGAIAKDLEKAIQRTGKQSKARGRGSELRVFRVAGMHVSAVWMHRSKKSATDMFVPYTPNFAGLRLGQIYKSRRFDSLLRRHATHMILRWYDRYEKSLTQLKAKL
jgi:hypothetical protein